MPAPLTDFKYSKEGLTSELLAILEDVINSKTVTLRKLVTLYVQIQTNAPIQIEEEPLISNESCKQVKSLGKSALNSKTSVQGRQFEKTMKMSLDGISEDIKNSRSQQDNVLIKVENNDKQSPLVNVNKLSKIKEEITSKEEKNVAKPLPVKDVTKKVDPLFPTEQNLNIIKKVSTKTFPITQNNSEKFKHTKLENFNTKKPSVDKFKKTSIHNNFQRNVKTPQEVNSLRKIEKSKIKSLRRISDKFEKWGLKGNSKFLKKTNSKMPFLHGSSLERYFSISQLKKDQNSNEEKNKFELKHIVSLPVLQEDINEKLTEINKRIAAIESVVCTSKSKDTIDDDDQDGILTEIFISKREKKRRIAKKDAFIPRVTSLLVAEGAIREGLSSFNSYTDLKATLSNLQSFDDLSYQKIFNSIQVVMAKLEINGLPKKSVKVPNLDKLIDVKDSVKEKAAEEKKL